MQSQGGKFYRCDCIVQILPRVQKLVKIVHHCAHNALQNNRIFVACAAIDIPILLILLISLLHLHPPSPNVSLKACQSCVCQGRVQARLQPHKISQKNQRISVSACVVIAILAPLLLLTAQHCVCFPPISLQGGGGIRDVILFILFALFYFYSCCFICVLTFPLLLHGVTQQFMQYNTLLQ